LPPEPPTNDVSENEQNTILPIALGWSNRTKQIRAKQPQTLKEINSVVSHGRNRLVGGIGASTRSRANFFMSKFRKLGFIHYNDELQVHSSLLNVSM